MTDSRLDNAIAIVGMAGHFPKARNVHEFWRRLRDREECVTHFDRAQLEEAGVPASVMDDPQYVAAAPILDDMEWFDAGFFGMSPRDAAIMDPQHRHFLECCWEAFEDAGHIPGRFDGSIGVFAGSGTNAYLWKNVMTNPDLVSDVGFFLLRHTGNDKDFLATRVSYAFDLKGPSVNVQTACSTSLVAVHYAMGSLLSGECDLALAGGVTIEQPHREGYLFRDGEILSPDGHCRPFDAQSEGTLFGSGAGAVLLRRYDEAVADGDHIYAVILGSAINNDGAGKVGYLAPSVDGQASAIREALAIADVSPDSIGYVEAHGTGTRMGDPIEVTALTKAFRSGTNRNGFCGIGSVKSNIGHLDTAAGVASLIKVALSLEHEEIPATLHYDAPNPNVDWGSTPFYVEGEGRSWPRGGTPRRAGVSSLGVGGTNAHIVLEEAPAAARVRETRRSDDHWRMIPLSAKSRVSLDRAGLRLAEFLEDRPESDLTDVSHTLRTGRDVFNHRRVVLARSPEEVIDALGAVRSDDPLAGEVEAERTVVFMFAGGGSQYPGMGAELYDAEPVYREVLDRCLDIASGGVGVDLRQLLFPEAGAEEAAARELRRPTRALPVLFSVQYAMARLLQSWGIAPSGMIGHSMGEYTAACLAGVFTLEDAIRVVSLRGRLFEQLPEGGMSSVPLAAEDVGSRLPEELSIAAVNAPELCVVAGPVPALEAFERRLAGEGVEARRIHIDVAAHSKELEPILGPFAEGLQSIRFHPPTAPFLSNLSGDWVGAEAQDPKYWVRHLRETVRFADGIGRVLMDDDVVLLEVGPGRTLATLARLHPEAVAERTILTTMSHPDDPRSDHAAALETAGRLWIAGVPLALDAVDSGVPGRRISLPTYAFDKSRHFIEPGTVREFETRDAVDAEDTSVRPVDRWLSKRTWRPRAQGTPMVLGSRALVVGAGTFPDAVARGLSDRGVDVVRAADGSEEGQVELTSDEAWSAVLRPVLSGAADPVEIVFVVAGLAGDGADSREAGPFYAPVHLLRGLEGCEPDVPIRVTFVTSGLAGMSERPIDPWQALLLGPATVAPREFPGLTSRVVDLEWGENPSADDLLNEMETDPGPHRLALSAIKDGVTYEADFEAESLPPRAEWPLQKGSTYLITGGLGGLGLALAEELARACPEAELILLGRTPRPTGDEAGDDARWAALRALEQGNGSVRYAACDLTDRDALEELVASLHDVRGVFHTAGVLDDAPILAKSDEEWGHVLAPKVCGTVALYEALADHPLDYFVCFSSRSAVTGTPGQVDYAAANAFMDQFAATFDRPGRRVLSVGWDAWAEVGMAARLFGTGEPEQDAGDAAPDWMDLEHPIFNRWARAGEVTHHAATFAHGTHWMLDEHRVKDGPPLIPGSGYMEILRAAGERHFGTARLELDEVMFLAPFVVRPGERRLLTVEITPGDGRWAEVEIRGRLEDGSPQTDVAYVKGRIAPLEVDTPKKVKLRAVRKRCKGARRMKGQTTEHPHLDFGPRWGNLVRVDVGASEVLASLELPTGVQADVGEFPLHPALLDLATAAGLEALPDVDLDQDFFVPTSYGSVQVHGPLSPRLESHVQVKNGSGNGVAVLDVTMMDPDGHVRVLVHDFVMMKVEAADLVGSIDEQDPVVESDPEAVEADDWRRWAIPTAQGLDVLRRLVAAPPSVSHVLVTPRPVPVLIGESADMAAASRPARRPAPPVDTQEIERVLQAHEAIQESAVVASWVGDDDYRIVAFVVYAPGAYATVSEVRKYLRGTLGAELIPHSFVEMTALPRFEDGYVDRRALPNPFEQVDDYVEPRTDTERIIARIWEDLLGVDRVGVHDNFLDVGGHSLVGIRTLLRIEKETGHRLHPNALTLQTLEQLAAECDQHATNGSEPAPQAESLAGRILGAVRSSAGGSA